MTIEKGTRIGRRNGPGVDGVQGYDWFTYCNNDLAKIVQSGNHKPTVGQMLDAGCMVVVSTDYNPATHRLIQDSFSDNGVEIKQNVIAFTLVQIEENAAAALAVKRELMVVDAWQIRLALTAADLRDTFEDLVLTKDQTTRDGWNHSPTFKRNNTLIVDAAHEAGLTDLQIDQVFDLAMSLQRGN